jgi:hypothetical protein
MAHKDNQDKHSKDNADKDFGLPKVEITPLPSKEAKSEPQQESLPAASAPIINENEAKPEASQPKEEISKPGTAADTPERLVPPVVEKKESSNKWAWISVILILLLVVLGAGWWWYGQEKGLTPEPQQITTIAEPEITEEPEVIVEEPETIEEGPETFTLTPIKSRAASPRYFVVVGSFIDEDMALDYSARLNRQNKNTYLVYPYGEIAYYRLAIGEYATLAQAVEVLDEHQANYKENLWVLKY